MLGKVNAQVLNIPFPLLLHCPQENGGQHNIMNGTAVVYDFSIVWHCLSACQTMQSLPPGASRVQNMNILSRGVTSVHKTLCSLFTPYIWKNTTRHLRTTHEI